MGGGSFKNNLFSVLGLFALPSFPNNKEFVIKNTEACAISLLHFHTRVGKKQNKKDKKCDLGRGVGPHMDGTHPPKHGAGTKKHSVFLYEIKTYS